MNAFARLSGRLGCVLFTVAFSLVSFEAGAVILESPRLTEITAHSKKIVPLVVGVQIDADMGVYEEAVNVTIQALKEQFSPNRLHIQFFKEQELLARLQAENIDYLLTTADFFSRANTHNPRLNPIASLWPRYASSPSEVDGALYFTRASNRAARTAEDLNRQSIALTSVNSFTGWVIPRRDALRRGFNPRYFFEKVSFYGDDPMDVVTAVSKSQAYAGVLPIGVFEKLCDEGRIKAGDFRLIGAKKTGTRGVSFSTELYPSLYISRTERINQRQANLMIEALRSSRILNAGYRWGPPASDRMIHDLFYDLKIGPYEKIGQWSFADFLSEHKLVVSACAGILLLIIFYSMIVSYAVRKRTQELRFALQERERIERDAIASRDRIANLERAGMIGQMSTMIAHELKQPIGAITNFAHGMLRRVKRGDIDAEVLINVLEEIVAQGTRAGEIVNRVRSYAKQKTPTLVTADLSVSVERAVENFKRSRRSAAHITTDVAPYLWADIDDWEIELAVLNLLKNADDSVKEASSSGEIHVHVFKFEQYWRIEVSDNGPSVTQEHVDKFMMLFMTTKASGLGLGLSLVSSIAERHKGRLIGRANPTRGVTLSLDIPRSEIEPEDV